jgi:hypothetical protein
LFGDRSPLIESDSFVSLGEKRRPATLAFGTAGSGTGAFVAVSRMETTGRASLLTIVARYLPLCENVVATTSHGADWTSSTVPSASE